MSSGIRRTSPSERAEDWPLIWIDARDATIARWRNGAAVIDRVGRSCSPRFDRARSPLTFNARQIVLHFDPSINDARIVAGGIRQLVRRFQNLHRSEDDLVAAIDRYVGDYCLATRLISRTANVIEFAATLRPPCPPDLPERRRTRAASPVKAASPLG